MIRTKAQKQQLVTTLAAKLKRARTLYVTDFTGLNVARITDLRRRLRAAGVEYVVVKNTLALRALGEAQLTGGGLEPHLDGPTALVLARITVGLIEGKTIAPELVTRLAALPAREALLAQLGGVLQAPLAAFAGAMNGLFMTMVGALEALKHKKAGA